MFGQFIRRFTNSTACSGVASNTRTAATANAWTTFRIVRANPPSLQRRRISSTIALRKASSFPGIGPVSPPTTNDSNPKKAVLPEKEADDEPDEDAGSVFNEEIISLAEIAKAKAEAAADEAAAAAASTTTNVTTMQDDLARPWYADGLKFGCTACGKCCTGKGGVVRVNEQEILALSEAKQMTYQEFGRRYLVWDKHEKKFHLKDRSVAADRGIGVSPAAEGACIFLDGKTCSVYSARPAQCRTFPFWPRFIESKEAWDQLGTTRCEGVNHPTQSKLFDENFIYSQAQIQTIHDSGENYTYDEMMNAIKVMAESERAEHERMMAELASVELVDVKDPPAPEPEQEPTQKPAPPTSKKPPSSAH